MTKQTCTQTHIMHCISYVMIYVYQNLNNFSKMVLVDFVAIGTATNLVQLLIPNDIMLYNVIVTNYIRADADNIRGMNTLILLIPLNYNVYKKDVNNKCIFMYHVNITKCNGSNY